MAGQSATVSTPYGPGWPDFQFVHQVSGACRSIELETPPMYSTKEICRDQLLLIQ